jgi:hypothetical protein
MVPDTSGMPTTAISLLRDGVLDAELAALIWLMGERDVPLTVIGDAPLEARSELAGALLSLPPARAWVLIDADAEAPTPERLTALLRGGVGLGLTMSLPGLAPMLEGAGPLHALPEDGIRRLGVVLVVDGVEAGLRCRSAHYLRPSERDAQGHVQRRPPAVLATWDKGADRFEHYAWGITPELADRVDRAQADFEERQRQRATALEVISSEAISDDAERDRLAAYLTSEPARVPAPSHVQARPSPFHRGLTEPHQH